MLKSAPESAQTFSVKRAQVEFHNFASLGEPENAISLYEAENIRRGELILKERKFIGSLSPFLEIGANAGHTSYMLANEFGSDGFALDISADALRHGMMLMDRWGMSRAPVRVAGDALNLPFRDESLRFVMMYQTLSQFMDIESVFVEIKRVLAPGGVFLLAEEPLLRLLSLRLYRAPYYNIMKPWERKLYDWGLLGYLVRDVIGAAQEESFGIRQNHSMYLGDWHKMIQRHFASQEYILFVPERGPGERIIKRLAIRLDPYHSEWRAAHLLGGTLAAACRKAGEDTTVFPPIERFEEFLRCPDCHQPLSRDTGETLHCGGCGYASAFEGGVYNLLRAADRSELYPGDRDDVIDFSLPKHEAKLLDGWFELEGVFGGKYRWIGARASARLRPVGSGPQRLRVRGHAHENSFRQHRPVRVAAVVNGRTLKSLELERPGIFVYEADLDAAPDYLVEIHASPTWVQPPDDRQLSVHLGMLRLVPRE